MDDAALVKLYLHIGSRMKLRRSILHVNQQDMADKLNISAGMLDDIERGAIRITAPILVAVARTTKTPVVWFFESLTPLDGSGKPLNGSNVIHAVFGGYSTNTRQTLRNAA